MRRCIASLLNRELGADVEWGGLVIRGPAALVGNGGDVRLFVMCCEGLAEISPQGISDWVRRQEEGERPGKRAGNVTHEFIRPADLIVERTGVGLERGAKTVKEELLYTVPYMSNYILSKGCRPRHISLAADVLGLSGVVGEGVREVPLRLGGEGRKALAELSTRPIIMGVLEELWGGASDGNALLVLSTPLIVPQLVGRGRVTLKGVEEAIVGTIADSLRGCAEVGKAVFSVHPRVRPRVVPLQLGFDERRGRKGPILPALMPGAVFRAKVSDWREAYLRGAGYLRELGFGTILPIPSSPVRGGDA